MSTQTFADVVHQSLSFSSDVPSQALILKLIDTKWAQRLRDISQTANTRLVYMFSEHSRFGHSLGVAFLAESLMEKLAHNFGAQIAPYRSAVAAAAILHDIGHLAPGSHTAFKTWFPHANDVHEQLAVSIIREDKEIQDILGRELGELTISILTEEKKLPPWTQEILSGGGWNVDRGNWCVVDSVMAGVKYGHYNIEALTESIVITDDGHLALKENRLDSMMHFAVSRHAMYRQIYQHRVLLAADMLNRAIVQRARDYDREALFADAEMVNALEAKDPLQLEPTTIFRMREYWWRYHLSRWSEGEDKVLADLCDRLLHRRLFKTIRVANEGEYSTLMESARIACQEAGFDPKYYLHDISTFDMQAGDLKQAMSVLLDNGNTLALAEADPLFSALLRETSQARKRWIAVPAAVKEKLGRLR